MEEEGKKAEHYLGWEWHQIPAAAQKLKVLVEEGLIRINYSSRSSTCYLVQDSDLARQALGATDEGVQEGQAPGNLFGHIVGHDEVKFWMQKSLASTDPVHILLSGPPATAKSLFLEAVGSLSGAQYALGGSSSKAGIADFLINFRPRYLIIDELDKMRGEDFSVLLSLMQSGVVARLKRQMREVEQMTTWVFAGVNRRDRLPPELLSRFVEFQFTPYSEQEFTRVAEEVISRQLGKDRSLARYTAEQVAKRTRDVRQAIQVARLCDSKEEVDRFEGGKGGPPPAPEP